MKLGQAAFAGLTGAAVSSLLFGIGRAFGLPLDVEQLVGALITGAPGIASWTLGLAALMVAGSVVALGYAIAFQRASCGVDVRLGMALGCVQATLAGVAVGLVPLLAPGVAERLDAPGIFVSSGVSAGAGAIAVVLFAAGQLAFAAVVTAIYRSVAQPAPSAVRAPDLVLVQGRRGDASRDATRIDRRLDRAA